MKYIDSINEIHKNTSGEVYRIEIAEILQYLDDHPELTGKAITADRYRQVQKMDSGYIRGYDDALRETGTIVLPEPTNVELLEAEIKAMFQEPSQSFSIARDLAKKLDKAGWTKAPEGDDE